MTIQPKFLSTGIGSMPFTNEEHAVDVALARMDAPIWPQLPKFGLNEQMEIQYSEGMPCAVIERDKGRMFFDTSQDTSEALAAFYEIYMKAMDPDSGDGDCSALAISPQFSKGLHAMLKRLKASGKKLPFLKVQTTGPCSFALTITDQDKRAIFYNEEFRDALTKALAMKCVWQMQTFQPYADKLICFIDEPILSAFGSATYVSVKREDVVSLINQLVEAVHSKGGLAGVHCCGNTEWSILIDAGVDIVNFDAFEYGKTIAMYPDSVKAHLTKGGMLAWGVVPTSKAIREQTAEGLATHLEAMMDHLAAQGIDKKLIAQQALVTPSCGTGSLDPADAEKVFETLAGVSKIMKQKYGF